MNAPPPIDGRAIARLLDHCTRCSGLAQAPAGGRERLEAAVGDELARRLVTALAGDHRIPARSVADF